ncbi:DUF1622 domain-containing protein [Deinococcus roseus]|uniref:DUF1622 domain-containing protein n=1 Tax=Deinococcus roseus TaxID=392414 RepID=A0ABQ2CT71_9DEIO|nr:DUF1622 domain-containing protein [Deinococcus roseus]GGJ18095.1 hypothetical protein GCM10008938_00290 [Deinococcus roseus]
MEETIKHWTNILAFVTEGVAGLIIGFAIVQAAWKTLRVMFSRPGVPDRGQEEVRLKLARWLAVALEFELAADILRTAVAPTWDEIGKLAAIAALRTLLNYFLEREIQSHARAEAKGIQKTEDQKF